MWDLSPGCQRFIEEKVRPLMDEHTQKFHQRVANDYEIYAKAFKSLAFKHPWRHEVLIRLWQIMWPKSFVFEAQGMVNEWCLRMAKGFCENILMTMVGCASSTKSYCAAMYCYTMWKTSPFQTSVYLSTTSAEAGEARMWGVIKKLFVEDVYQIGKRIDSMQLICLDDEVKDDENVKNRDMMNVIKFVKIKKGNEGADAVGAICGRKNKRVIWCADELNFMELGVLNARVNLFSNPFAQFIGIGNAPSEGSPLYIDAEPVGDTFPDGYRSVNIDLHEEWPTKTGKCLYFNGTKSPNFRAPDPKNVPFPFMMNPTEAKKMAQASGGEDTNYYWIQVHGFPPGVDVSDKVVNRKFLEANRAMEKVEWSGAPTKMVAGVDCGFRKGGDPTMIDFCEVGKTVEGSTVGDFGGRDAVIIPVRQGSADPFEKQMARGILDRCVERGCHDVGIDISGDGGMTATALKDEAIARGWKLNLVPISFSGTPDEKVIIQGERRTAAEIFDRKVTQIWMSFREAVRQKLVRGINPHAVATSHLCSRKFSTDERKRFSVEKKEDMKKRLGRSPDAGDARTLGLLMAISAGISLAAPVKMSTPGIVTGGKKLDELKGRYGGHSTVARYAGR